MFVYLHPFNLCDGFESYCDSDEATNWCVYLENGTEQYDFPSYDAALQYANALADEHGWEVREY